MSALRKLRAARTQQKLLAPVPDTAHRSSSDDDDDIGEPVNAFDLLQQQREERERNQRDDSDEDNDEDESDESASQSLSPSPTPVAAPVHRVSRAKPSRAKPKPSKAKASASASANADDIDDVLRELGLEQPLLSPSSSLTTAEGASDWAVLATDPKHIDATAEIRARFGSAAIRAPAADEEKAATVRVRGRTFRTTAASQSISAKRQRLVRVGKDWPPVLDRGDLKMAHANSVNDTPPVPLSRGLAPIDASAIAESQSQRRSDWLLSSPACPLFEFVHSNDYDRTEQEYLSAVATHDLQSVMHFSRVHPYHVGCCLQMSEIAESQGEFIMAHTFVQRALHFIDISLAREFALNSATSRLDPSLPANQGFFIALARHAQMLAKKGCNRTALEVSKLLLSLSPLLDPQCVCCLIDYYALRSHQYAFVVNFAVQLDRAIVKHSQRSPWPALTETVVAAESQQQQQSSSTMSAPRPPTSSYPNLMFSRALAAFHLDDASPKPIDDGIVQPPALPPLSQAQTQSVNASRLLCQAIAMFPEAVFALLEHSSRSKESSSSPWQSRLAKLKSLHPSSQSQLVDKLVLVFSERSGALWKTDAVYNWLTATVDYLLDGVNAGKVDMLSFRTARLTYFPPNAPVPASIRDLQRSQFTDAVARLPPELLLAQAEARGVEWQQAMAGDAFDYRQLPVDQLRAALRENGMQPLDVRGQNPLVVLLRTLMPNIVPHGGRVQDHGQVVDDNAVNQEDLLVELENGDDEWQQVDAEGDEEDLGEH